MVIVYLSVALVFVFWAYLAITDLSWDERYHMVSFVLGYMCYGCLR